MKKGFSLLECLIYSGLSLLFIISLYEYFVKAKGVGDYCISSFNRQQQGTLLGIILLNDFYSAVPLKTQWDSTHCIFVKQTLNEKGQKSEICVQWELKKHTLYRSYGLYAFEKKIWNEKKTTIMNTSVSLFSTECIEMLNKNEFEGVRILMHFSNNSSYNGLVMFRNNKHL